MKEEEIIKYLNNTVYCRLGPSKIHGVGVFAMRDIPRGIRISDHNFHYIKHTVYELSPKNFKKLRPEIQGLILDRMSYSATDEVFIFNSPNSDQMLQAFMNHSDDANCDGHYATRDIKKGEEITENYNSLTKDRHKINIAHDKKNGMPELK